MMRKISVLIVEDEIFTAEALRLDLEDMGFEVCSLESSGEKALEAAEQLKPDVVLMDGRLRGRLSGFEAAKTIRRRFGIPIIYMSGYSEQEIREMGETDDPFVLVTKPVQLFEVKDAITSVLSNQSDLTSS